MNSKNPNGIGAYMNLKLSLKLMGWKPKDKRYGNRSPFAWIDPTKCFQIRRLNPKKENHKYAIVTEINSKITIFDKCDSYLDLLECVANFNTDRTKK